MSSVHTIITDDIIAKEALMSLENEMVFGKLVHRDYKNEWGKIGSTVRIRRPVKFTVRDGATFTNQNVVENYETITINKQKGVDFSFSSSELTESIDKFSERYIKPAVSVLANQVDTDLANLVLDIPNAVGTVSTTPSSFATSVALVGARMDLLAMPRDNRHLVLDPASYWSMAGGQTALLQDKLVKTAYEAAKLGTMGGFDVFQSQNIVTHTAGTMASCEVSGASQTGSSIYVLGGAGTTFTVGDVVTLAGSYDVNPITKTALSHLKQFTVTTALTLTGSRNTLVVSPSIATSGAYQNVSASPTTTGAVTKVATHVAGIGFTKQTFALVFLPMELPQGAAFKSRQTYNDLSIRFIRQYDIDADVEKCRFDILYGVKTIYPETGCRLVR
jgi:hypothetical protein